MKINFKKIFNTILFSLFILYICLYFASSNGYYEYQNKEEKEFTEEKMKEFESDIRQGKKVDIKNYLVDKNKSYDNKITTLGNNLSDIIDKTMSNGLEKTFKLIEKMIE